MGLWHGWPRLRYVPPRSSCYCSYKDECARVERKCEEKQDVSKQVRDSSPSIRAQVSWVEAKHYTDAWRSKLCLVP